MRDVAGDAIGGELEKLQSLIAQHDDVFIPIVVHVADEAARVLHAGFTDHRLAVRAKRSVAVQQHAETAVAFADEQVVRAAMVDVKHADGAVKISIGDAESGLRRVSEDDLHAATVRLLQPKRNAHLRVNATFKRGSVGGRVGLAGDELLVAFQGLLRLLLPSQPQQGLTEKKIRRRIVRGELDDFGKLPRGVLVMPQLHLGAAKLEADGVDFWIEVLGLLYGLDRFLELPQAHVRATSDVTGRRGIGLHAQYLLRELDGTVALVREQTGVGEIQQRIGMSRLERNRLLKRFNRFGRLALFVVTLAGIHQTSELVVARRRLPPQPEAKKQRSQNDGRHHNEVNRHTSLGMVRCVGLHGGRLTEVPVTARRFQIGSRRSIRNRHIATAKNNFRSGSSTDPLTRPPGTLSPSQGERDGVRGHAAYPEMISGNHSSGRSGNQTA